MQDDDSVNEEDIVKFMLFVLLMLNRRRSKNRGYNEHLLRTGFFTPPAPSSTKRPAVQEAERYVACGQSHCGLVVRGKAYTWGRAQFGRLGHRESHKEILGITCVEVLDTLRVKVSQVACGTHHTLFNTDAGALLHGHQRHLSPTEVDLSVVRGPLVSMACGSNHALLLTRDGEVYAFGRNTEGQLGLGSRKDQLACKLPAEESSVRHLRVLSSRLITIRTSRCLITIPQGQRTGEVRPIEVTALPPEITRPPLDDLEQSLRQKAFQNAYLSRSAPTFDLGSLDDPPYGPVALHTALEVSGFDVILRLLT
ncbi:hypothetical protein V5799_007996 [Amblyomma americanum]|uniref:Uncharacterized protein n=1 Tax=Amblyomma americanum TaxID=6943 RepID=A0AAQ4FEI6_AMBAM